MRVALLLLLSWGDLSSGHRELQAAQLAERLPRTRVASGVEDLVVWASEPQPGIHARSQPGIGPEVPVWHLEVGELRGVEHLPLGYEQPESLPSERDQRGEGRRPWAVLEQERRRVVERSDPERPLDQPHGPVLAGQAPIALAHVTHEDR